MTEQPDSNTSLASTAYWTASVRALESTRQDRLFNDPWAEQLAGEIGLSWLAQRSPVSVIPIILRTRFFDDCLEQVTQLEGLRQVVLLAAGLDTRAYRLHWPSETRVFELDQPAVLTYKEQTLHSLGAKPACTRQAVGVDLSCPWKDGLLQSGFEPQMPTAWLLEGFLFYLPTEQIEKILEDVSSLSAPGSWLGFDIINSLVLTHPLTRPWVDMQAASGAPWIGVMDDPQGFLAERKWNAALTQAGQPEANFGRWSLPMIPPTAAAFPHNWYITAWLAP